jgi:NADH-quinone oxidoreductase subunit F
VCTRLAEGNGRPGDVDLLSSIAFGIAGNTICALGDAAAWPMLGFLTKFRDEFEARLPVAREGDTEAGVTTAVVRGRPS